MPKSDPKTKRPKPEPEPEAETPEPQEARGEAAEAEDPLARLESEVAALKDQLLRALAETENVRRRAQREREEALRYAPAPLVRDLIEVADNLRRALEAVPAEAVEADEHLRTLMTGVEMTEKALQAVFEKHHIEKIEPLGQPLDPHLHEAIFEIPDPSHPAGTVLQVVRAGYRLHDRLVRPAQVGVAKGGPPKPDAPRGENERAEAGPPQPGEAKGDGAAGPDDGRAPGSRIDTTA